MHYIPSIIQVNIWTNKYVVLFITPQPYRLQGIVMALMEYHTNKLETSMVFAYDTLVVQGKVSLLFHPFKAQIYIFIFRHG